MTVGRFTGDALVNRFTEATVVRVSMALAGSSLGLALLVGTTWAYVGACVVIGLAVATLFPAAMHAATRIPGVRPAMGVATVGWIARGGFVVAPIAVGAIAERFGIWNGDLEEFEVLDSEVAEMQDIVRVRWRVRQSHPVDAHP